MNSVKELLCQQTAKGDKLLTGFHDTDCRTGGVRGGGYYLIIFELKAYRMKDIAKKKTTTKSSAESNRIKARFESSATTQSGKHKKLSDGDGGKHKNWQKKEVTLGSNTISQFLPLAPLELSCRAKG